MKGTVQDIGFIAWTAQEHETKTHIHTETHARRHAPTNTVTEMHALMAGTAMLHGNWAANNAGTNGNHHPGRQDFHERATHLIAHSAGKGAVELLRNASSRGRCSHPPGLRDTYPALPAYCRLVAIACLKEELRDLHPMHQAVMQGYDYQHK